MLVGVMPTRVSSARFVGRTTELAELEAAQLDAAAGRPSLVFVAGESGMGKTRLVRELETRARAEGVRVLHGDCVEVGEGELPYAPLVGILRPLARDGDPVLAALPAGVRAELARLLPALGEAGDVADVPEEGAGQGRVFEALLHLLVQLGQEQPVLLAIEDVHWADRSTRAFLSFLARALGDERVLTVATYRSDELHRRHALRPLLADLERDARVRRMELAPLTREELAEALAGILGSEPERDLVDRLLARSQGNPLFMEELLAGGLDGRGALPGSLRDALMVRVERLDDDAQEVLRALAVGGRLDHDGLCTVTGLDERRLRDAIRETTAAHIVVVVDEDGNHAFRHALLREVVHDDLLPGERTALHLAVARALAERLEGTGAQRAARIAHHYAQGGDATAALRTAVWAAGAAEEVHAYGEAASLLERALELFDRVPDAETVAGADRASLLERAGIAHSEDSDRMRAHQLFAAAVEQIDREADPLRAARLLEALGRTRWHLGRGKEGLATAESGLALLDPDEPTRERARLLSWLAKARMLQGRFRETVVQADEAIAAADAAGDRISRGRALNARGVALILLGDVAAGRESLLEARRVGIEVDMPNDIASAYVNLSDSLHLRGESEEALAVAIEGSEVHARRVGRPYVWQQLLIAEICTDLGDWAEADRRFPTATGRYSGSDLMNLSLRRAELALGRGQHDLAAEQLEIAERTGSTSTEPQYLGPLGALLAELKRRQGDLDGARATVAEYLDRMQYCTDDVMRLGRLMAAGVVVEADRAERARDLDDAADAAQAIAAAEQAFLYVEAAADEGGPVEHAWHDTATADLERARGANDPAAWAAAARAWESVGRPLAAAAARLREAEACAERGHREAASAAAAAARAAASPAGATWLLCEVDGLVARARLSLADETAPPVAAAAPVADEPFGLTPRERQVLELVAAGATNREIGAALFMAEKTASVHVSRILAKLGVRSRTQAAAVAHRAGLG
jgi:DNA-binding CsgD family transcriptional regulator/tetratricopeptide (TPR) repeat protein